MLKDELIKRSYELKFRPNIKPNELLSSWMIRVAHFYGAQPVHFWHMLLQSYNVWNRDIDFHLSRITAKKLNKIIGFQYKTAPQKELHRESHWLLSLGIYHRKRTAFGQQYCPLCLSEQSYWRREWRLSFHTICPIHKILLHDRCSSCHRPIEPLYSFDSTDLDWICPSCKTSLTHVKTIHQNTSEVQKSLTDRVTQPLLNSNTHITHSDYSIGTRILCQLQTRLITNNISPYHSFNDFSPTKRHSILLHTGELLEHWPEKYVDYIQSVIHYPSIVTQVRRTTPTWLLTPLNISNNHQPTKHLKSHLNSKPQKHVKCSTRMEIENLFASLWQAFTNQQQTSKWTAQQHRNFLFAYTCYALCLPPRMVCSIHCNTIQGKQNFYYLSDSDDKRIKISEVNNPLWKTLMHYYLSTAIKFLPIDSNDTYSFVFPPFRYRRTSTWCYKPVRSKFMELGIDAGLGALTKLGRLHAQEKMHPLQTEYRFAINSNFSSVKITNSDIQLFLLNRWLNHQAITK